jgi:hypothetical protein
LLARGFLKAFLSAIGLSTDPMIALRFNAFPLYFDDYQSQVRVSYQEIDLPVLVGSLIQDIEASKDMRFRWQYSQGDEDFLFALEVGGKPGRIGVQMWHESILGSVIPGLMRPEPRCKVHCGKNCESK